MARHAHEISQKPSFIAMDSDDFTPSHIIEEQFDRAIEREQRENAGFPVARITSEELITQQEQYGDAVERGRAYMKALSIPLYELIGSHARNRQPSDEIIHEVNHAYTESGALLRDFTTEREATKEKRLHQELTGAISEVAFFALALRGRQKNGFVALPSRLIDDHAPVDATGKRHAFDFTVTKERDPSITFPIQVKTGDSAMGPRYAQAIPTISLQKLAGGAYHNGKYALPRAIGLESAHRESQFDRHHLGIAARILTRTFINLEEKYASQKKRP